MSFFGGAVKHALVLSGVLLVALVQWESEAVTRLGDAFYEIGAMHCPKEQRIARSQRFDNLDADLIVTGGGNFDGAGTGGHD